MDSNIFSYFLIKACDKAWFDGVSELLRHDVQLAERLTRSKCQG